MATPAIAIILIMGSFLNSACAMENANVASSKQINASLTEEYRDYGVDLNGDGLFDVLEIETSVDVERSGEYTVSGYLYDFANRRVAWSMDHKNLTSGRSIMRLEFDGRAIQQYGSSGKFILGNLLLSYGSSRTGMTILQQIPSAYQTSAYNFSQFASRLPDEKTISGSGNGELLLTVSIRKMLPVISGKYSLDITGIHIPPIASTFNVTGSKYGYAYDAEGTYLPNKPNNFTVTASKVKNLNIGLKKIQGRYDNSSAVWQGKSIRVWVSHQAVADENGIAVQDSDLISPGIYDARIFGDADNVSQVDITMTLIKKIFIDGRFHLSINTTGFPSGEYSINAQALDGALKLDELDLGGLSFNS
ncbi:MAG: hypothetical protein EHM14_02105 [Methanothrix sp.]|nr:MAG: hypothetical protein EHM14_02105 [Methanothrix sp.]